MTNGKRKLIIGVGWLVAGLFILGAMVGALAAHIGTTGRVGAPGAMEMWLLGGFAGLAIVGSFVISVLWMRSIDEAAREAHKSAWFWGGSGGMAVGMVVLILATVPGAETWSIPAWYAGRTDPAAYAATGAFGMLILMLIGYAIAWAWWWLARTRG